MSEFDFQAISPKDVENAVKLIGDDWMLITAKDEKNGRVNAMTASWGCMGVLWNKPVCVCFIRPQRHSFSLVEREERISLAFLGDRYRDALRLCGSKSGRDLDKLRAAGLRAVKIDGVDSIAEARLILICRKLYADDMKQDSFLDPSLLANYPNGDFHRIYVLEIEGAYLRETD